MLRIAHDEPRSFTLVPLNKEGPDGLLPISAFAGVMRITVRGHRYDAFDSPPWPNPMQVLDVDTGEIESLFFEPDGRSALDSQGIKG